MAVTPSLGEAISLQGRNQGTEQLGRIALQMSEAARNRALKGELEGLKGKKDKEKKELEQFDIPTGLFNRLVVPEINQLQGEYVAKLRQLKEDRPNDYGNEVPNLAIEYGNKMRFLQSASRDLDKYEIQTTSIDKANNYDSKQFKKFNPIYETATSLTDLTEKMATMNITGDAALQVRTNGTVSYTPTMNRKPVETISKNIEDQVTKLPFASSEKKARFGYSTKEVQVRPVTNKKSSYGVSKEEIALYNPQAAAAATSIEDIIDTYLETHMGDNGVFQYADQYDLPYMENTDGSLNNDSKEVIKDHMLRWASGFASPDIKTAFARPPSSVSVSVGDKEEGGLAAAVYEPSEIASTVAGKKSFKFGELGLSYEKDKKSISVDPSSAFNSDFEPVKSSTLSNVTTDGVLILAVDGSGKPMRYTDIPADNIKNISGADVFIRVKSGETASGFYYIKLKNYSQVTSQFMRKPNDATEQEINKMIRKSAMLDKSITNKKKNTAVLWEDLSKLPE